MVAMSRSEILWMCARLGERFRERGMQSHLKALLAYLAEVHASGWTTIDVLLWGMKFQLEPLERVVAVRPSGSACACGAQRDLARLTICQALELVRCAFCRVEWLERERSLVGQQEQA